nr:serine hydrolase domain-containing protein [Streptoalloteichus tenebrarius]
MALVADGDLELDEPVPDYDPGITVRRLLSHTSGLESNVDEDDAVDLPRRRWVARYPARRSPQHAPGTVFSYSNVGYVLAGHLVEDVTGMDWAEAVASILLRPLGITPAFVVGDPGPRPSVPGHVVTGDRVLPVGSQVMPEVEAPNGALALSSADLVAFADLFLADSLAGGGVLDREAAAPMCRDQLDGITVGPYGMADGWGLGWARYRGPDGDWYGHDGTGDGTSCHLRFEPESGTAVALTTNASTGAALWRDLADELAAEEGLSLGRSEEPDQTPVPGPPEAAGHYVNGHAAFVVTAQDGGGLALALDGDQVVPLTCLPDLRFRVAMGATSLGGRFLRDPDTGGIDLIQVTGRLARRRGGATG